MMMRTPSFLPAPFIRASRRAASLGLSAALVLGGSAVTLGGSAGVLCLASAGTARAETAPTPAPSKPPLAVSPNAASRVVPEPNSTNASSIEGDSDGDTPEQRLAKRRERLEQGAKRLRDRAAELRQGATSAGKAAPESKAGPGKPAAEKGPGKPAAENASEPKRPPRDPEEQAKKLDEQAQKMEERAKALTLEDIAERSPEAARKNRHRLRRAHINRRWGAATLHDPEAMAELSVHAERTAKLKRIQALARAKGKDDPVVARAKALLAREDARHEQHMKAIQDRVAPQSGSTTTATTAPEAK